MEKKRLLNTLRVARLERPFGSNTGIFGKGNLILEKEAKSLEKLPASIPRIQLGWHLTKLWRIERHFGIPGRKPVNWLAQRLYCILALI